MAPHSIILAWEFHGQRSLGSYSPWDCKSLTLACTHTHTLYTKKEENILLNFLLLKIKMNVISSLQKFLILFCCSVLLPITHTNPGTDLPAGCLGGHVTLPQWSCDLSAKRIGSASLQRVLPRQTAGFPKCLLTFELEFPISAPA